MGAGARYGLAATARENHGALICGPAWPLDGALPRVEPPGPRHDGAF